ncbi:MAG: hypothetical protein J6Y78_08460 [Paludibacteraceae bacterium]|nr:hypothetical protein [Paludibacteraceae bacterium]
MAYVYFCNNPRNKCRIGDCSVRAISKVLDIPWQSAYIDQATIGLDIGDMPSSNEVIAKVLRDRGFDKASVPNTCKDCYTISEFAHNNPYGRFLVGTGSHVVAVIDGDYYDTWDSGDEIPIYVWYNEQKPIF